MARAKRRKKRERARRLHEEPIVREIARILEAGRPTRWRYTSACRHGLRSAMCAKGRAWTDADALAAKIVVLARVRIGLSRAPSWTEARGDEPREVSYHFCRFCGGYQPGGDRPYCSPECAHAGTEQMRRDVGIADDLATYNARAVLLSGGHKAPMLKDTLRTCPACQTRFTPRLAVHRYCSLACTRAHRSKLMTCRVCRGPFHARVNSEKTCSPACRRALKTERQRQARAILAAMSDRSETGDRLPGASN